MRRKGRNALHTHLEKCARGAARHRIEGKERSARSHEKQPSRMVVRARRLHEPSQRHSPRRTPCSRLEGPCSPTGSEHHIRCGNRRPFVVALKVGAYPPEDLPAPCVDSQNIPIHSRRNDRFIKCADRRPNSRGTPHVPTNPARLQIDCPQVSIRVACNDHVGDLQRTAEHLTHSVLPPQNVRTPARRCRFPSESKSGAHHHSETENCDRTQSVRRATHDYRDS